MAQDQVRLGLALTIAAGMQTWTLSSFTAASLRSGTGSVQTPVHSPSSASGPRMLSIQGFRRVRPKTRRQETLPAAAVWSSERTHALTSAETNIKTEDTTMTSSTFNKYGFVFAALSLSYCEKSAGTCFIVKMFYHQQWLSLIFFLLFSPFSVYFWLQRRYEVYKRNLTGSPFLN